MKRIFLIENKQTKPKQFTAIFKQIEPSWVWVIWRILWFESTRPREIQGSHFDICWAFHSFIVADIHFSACWFCTVTFMVYTFYYKCKFKFQFCKESPRVITSVLVIVLIACLYSCLNNDAFCRTQFNKAWWYELPKFWEFSLILAINLGPNSETLAHFTPLTDLFWLISAPLKPQRFRVKYRLLLYLAKHCER